MSSSTQTNDLTDGQLLCRHLDDPQSGGLAELVRRHLDFVYSAARRQVGDAHLAEDITQDVFLLLMKKAVGLRDHQNVGGWLFQATMLTSRSAMRGRAREAARMDQLSKQPPPEAQDSSVATQSWAHIEPHVNAALERLSDAEREAVVLRYFQRHPYAQVAAALGMSEAAARQRVHRGLEHMRQFLSQSGGVVAGAAELSAALKLNGVQPAPAHLAANTLGAIARAQAGFAGAKGTIALIAALKAKAMAAALIVVSVITVVGVAAMVARHRGQGEAMYLDSPRSAANAAPAPGNGNDRAWPTTVRLPFQPIPAISFDDHKGTKPWAGFIGYINRGDWLRFNRVDLGSGGLAGGAAFTAVVACPAEYASNTIRVHQDRLDGPVIATLAVKPTGGYGTWKSQSAPLTTSGGIHDLFLEFSGGGWNLDAFRITLASRPAAQVIPAISFNESMGVQSRAGIVCETSDGSWVRYNGVEFGAGMHAVAITYACDTSHAGGSITLRLDGSAAPPIATLPVTDTGGWGHYATFIRPFDASGTHDVIVTFNGHWHGIADLLSIQFLEQAPVPPSTRPTTRPDVRPLNGS